MLPKKQAKKLFGDFEFGGVFRVNLNYALFLNLSFSISLIILQNFNLLCSIFLSFSFYKWTFAVAERPLKYMCFGV